MTRPKNEPPSCSVANSNCRCPANLEDRPRLRATCWHCGLPVCTDRGCSTMRRLRLWDGPPTVRGRVCAICAVTYEYPTLKETRP